MSQCDNSDSEAPRDTSDDEPARGSRDEDETTKKGWERFKEAVDDLSRAEMERRKYDDPSERGPLDDLADRDFEASSDRASETDDVTSNEPNAREQLQSALEALSPEEMYRRKFQKDPEERDDSESRKRGDSREELPPTSDEAAREELDREHRREARRFREAMEDVEPIDRSETTRAPSPPDPESRAESEEPSSYEFITPLLDKEGRGLKRVPPLNEAQQSMRERFRAWAEVEVVPELNVRGYTVEEAIAELESFVERCWREGDRFARVIPGRGLRSEGAPVLKPAVLTWFEEEGRRYLRGYIPERSVEGDYGSLVIELREA